MCVCVCVCVCVCACVCVIITLSMHILTTKIHAFIDLCLSSSFSVSRPPSPLYPPIHCLLAALPYPGHKTIKTFADGSRFEGEWKYGKAHGEVLCVCVCVWG